MSDFEKMKSTLFFLLAVVAILPSLILPEAPIFAIALSLAIIVPFLTMWVLDYRKFKRSGFKTYQQYWYYKNL